MLSQELDVGTESGKHLALFLEVRREIQHNLQTQASRMRALLHSLATVSIAASMMVGGVNTARAHASPLLKLNRFGNNDGTIILTDTKVQNTAVKFRRNVDRKGVILKGYDPVAYIKQGKAVKGKPSLSSTYHGATYYFASKANKVDFDQSPGKFEPQYGAFCAGNMLNGKCNEIDPRVFYVYHGKLYLCANAEIGRAFMAHPEQHIRQANKNWESYEPPRSPGFHEDQG